MFSKLLRPHHFKLQIKLQSRSGWWISKQDKRLRSILQTRARKDRIRQATSGRRRGGDGDAAAAARLEQTLRPPARAPLPRRAAPRRAAPAVRLGVVFVAGRGRWQQETPVGWVWLLCTGAAVAGHHLPRDQQLLRHQWLLPVPSRLSSTIIFALSPLELDWASSFGIISLQITASQVVHDS